MTTIGLGIAFLLLGLGAMFLMFHLWGYPYDKATRTSEAPRWAMYLHRVLGYLFALVYVAMMARMLPRLWEYQVEFPPRTVVHIVLGFTIGFLLIVKIAIVRFFRHFEEWMPYLGTAIMLGTVIMLGLSLPIAWREEMLARNAPGGSAFSVASQARVARLLPSAGFPAEAKLDELASLGSLRAGRDVLLDNCAKCHDLKTILDQPRTPEGWLSIVERMAEKPNLFGILEPLDQWRVTAYLVAITPDLQSSRKRQRERERAHDEAVKDAVEIAPEPAADAPSPPSPDPGPSSAGGDAAATPAAAPATTAPPPPSSTTATSTGPSPAPSSIIPPAKPKPAIDARRAKAAFEDLCTQCHELSDVDDAPPRTAREAREMILRMIKENDAEFSRKEISLLQFYLVAHYVKKQL